MLVPAVLVCCGSGVRANDVIDGGRASAASVRGDLYCTGRGGGLCSWEGHEEELEGGHDGGRVGLG